MWPGRSCFGEVFLNSYHGGTLLTPSSQETRNFSETFKELLEEPLWLCGTLVEKDCTVVSEDRSGSDWSTDCLPRTASVLVDQAVKQTFGMRIGDPLQAISWKNYLVWMYLSFSRLNYRPKWPSTHSENLSQSSSWLVHMTTQEERSVMTGH